MPQEAHETEQRCRLMIESVKDHGIFMLDAAGRIASWNKGAEQILGYTEAEILGQPFARFFPPEAASESEAELQKAAADGRAADDRWHVRKNGSRFWCSGVVTALRDAHGNSQGFVTVMRDLTHEKQLETALRDAPSYANAITNTLREPFVVLDKELRVKMASRSFYQWFGVTQEETENQFIFDLGNGQWNKPRLREVLAAVLDNSGVAADFTVQHTFPGIGHRIMSLNASRCFDQTELILLAFADVTAIRLAEDDMRRQADELAANSQRKDEFLAMLSHELRNPLASILSAVELLQCLDADHEAEAQARVTIERQVRHLARMVDDLLEVSRGTTGRVRLDLQQVELRIDRQAVDQGNPPLSRRAQASPLGVAPACPALNPSRSGSSSAGDRESAPQRGQVYRRRRQDSVVPRKTSEPGSTASERQWHRHRARAPAQRIHHVSPRRCIARPESRWIGDRAVAGSDDRREAWRHRGSLQCRRRPRK